ncbi:MAG: sugar phosphate isomerase/epimerase family protein [Anaerolineae bacterium]|nr:sugar phosphate isomerase/epimerase family protein [Anaerolineae bacterium]
MRISVFTVCMPEYSLQETVDLLGRLGYDGVEWRVQRIDPALADEPPSFWRHNRSTVDLSTIVEEAPALRELARGAGLEVPCLATYIPCQDEESAERVMRAATMLGAPMVRLGVPRYDRTRPYPELYAEARRHLQAVSRLAAAYGVRVLVEIHMGTIIPSAGLAHRLLDGLDPELVGAIYDPGNMICEGYEAWRMGMELLGPYLAHVHVKNYAWQAGEEDAAGTQHWAPGPAPLARGMVDWGEVIADLRAVGYQGYLSLEDFDTTAGTAEKLAADIDYLRRVGA